MLWKPGRTPSLGTEASIRLAFSYPVDSTDNHGSGGNTHEPESLWSVAPSSDVLFYRETWNLNGGPGT